MGMHIRSAFGLAVLACLAACGPSKPPPFETAPTEAAVSEALSQRFAQATDTAASATCASVFSLQSVAVVEDPQAYYMNTGPSYVVDVHAIYTATRLRPARGPGEPEVFDCFGEGARVRPDWPVGATEGVRLDKGLRYRGAGWVLVIGDEAIPLADAAPHPFRLGTNGHPPK